MTDVGDRAVKGVGLQPLDCWVANSKPADSMDVSLLCLLCVE